MSQKSYDGKPTLYLVPTPIGNLDDITIRAINVLKESEVIFSEDTRETKKLLNYYEIDKKLIASHKYNENESSKKVLDYLDKGFNVSIVSDRGTPGICDPGFEPAYQAINKGYNVVCLPGATAFTPALVMSGLNPNKFLFYGFLDSKKSTKKKELETLKNENYTIIVYESPYRVVETLKLINEIMPGRKVSVAREISKKHEEVYRGLPNEIIDELGEPKGEFVVLIEENKDKETYEEIDIVSHVDKLINEGEPEKDAIKKVAKLHGLIKNDVYIKYKEAKK
ncbi:MAG: 16S rRNA (cytidine(1402)-2'-O)-methyltransferase [Bacilli bacterium]|nr:16S rRNA (cytidine(1402)-2'-O)-methyltransferase [Bacilli bacterium]